MTRKNKAKRHARERQKLTGGKYLLYYRIETPGGVPAGALNVDALVQLARQQARHLYAAGAMDVGPVTFVALDVADDFGADLARRISALSAAARASDKPMPESPGAATSKTLARFVSSSALAELLRVALGATRIDVVVELTALFSSDPPPAHVHVFVAGAGEIAAAVAPTEQLCWCGHAKSEHSAGGGCEWFGVPDARPMPGVMPASLVESARRTGTPLRCACGGRMGLMRADGRIEPMELDPENIVQDGKPTQYVISAESFPAVPTVSAASRCAARIPNPSACAAADRFALAGQHCEGITTPLRDTGAHDRDSLRTLLQHAGRPSGDPLQDTDRLAARGMHQCL